MALQTIRQFMHKYNVSRSTVYRLIARGEIPAVRIGRSVRIPSNAAEEWARSLPVL